MNRIAAPASAGDVLRGQFSRLPHDFIALRDIGPPASARLLAALGNGHSVRHLDLCAEAGGPVLAALPCVDLAGPLRVYGNPIDAAPSVLDALAVALLGCSRLGVLMIGDTTPQALDDALQPLREAMSAGQWSVNRSLLLVPLASASALALPAAALALHGGIEVRVTPPASRPDEAWRYIVGAWNRLRGAPAPVAGPAETGRAEATAAARPVAGPERAPNAPADFAQAEEEAARAEAWQTWLSGCRAISGVLHACVFDRASARILAHEGEPRTARRLADQGNGLVTAIAAAGAALGLNPAATDAAVTLGGHHLLLATLPGHPGLAVHLMLDARLSNPTLARLQFARMVASAPTPGP